MTSGPDNKTSTGTSVDKKNLPGTLPPLLANALGSGPVPLDVHTLGRTLVLAPHPDDESLGCGGTLALLRRAGLAVHVVFVSDGTLSHPNSATYPAARLRDLREAEALEALRELGVSEWETTFLRLPDRHVPGVGLPGFAEAASRLLVVLNAFAPTSVLVPFERDPHPGVEQRTLEYLIWLWELGRPDDMPRPGERIAFSVDINPVLAEKKRAIAAHRSQVTRLIDDDEASSITERLDDVYAERPFEFDTGLAALQALAIDEDW